MFLGFIVYYFTRDLSDTGTTWRMPLELHGLWRFALKEGDRLAVLEAEGWSRSLFFQSDVKSLMVHPSWRTGNHSGCTLNSFTQDPQQERTREMKTIGRVFSLERLCVGGQWDMESKWLCVFLCICHLVKPIFPICTTLWRPTAHDGAQSLGTIRSSVVGGLWVGFRVRARVRL